MAKFYNSLMFQLTVSFVLLILVITGLTYMYTYGEAKKALKSTIQDELKQVADMAASQMSGPNAAVIADLKVGEDGSERHMALINTLYSMRKNNADISEFYVMTYDGEVVRFVVDDWYIDTPDEYASIGDEYTDYDPELLEAFDGKIVSSADFYTDDWGTFLSGYAPVKDSEGKVVAAIAVDMRVDTVQHKINFIGSLIYYVMGAAIIAAAIMILFFSMTIVGDLNRLTKVANKISEGNLDIELPNIKSKNEIHELNEGMKSVFAAVQMYKGAAEECEKGKKKAK